MIVEFVGLPGAGKTTLRDALAARLTSMGMPVEARHLMRQHSAAPSRLVHRAAAAASYPSVTAAALLAMTADHRPWQERIFGLRITAVTLDNYRWLSNGSSSALLDEGLIQRGFLLFTGRPDAEPSWLSRRYARAIPLPDVVVHLVIDPGEAIQRVSGRDRYLPARYARLDADTLAKALVSGARVLDHLLDEIDHRPRCPRRITIRPQASTLPTLLDDVVAELAPRM